MLKNANRGSLSLSFEGASKNEYRSRFILQSSDTRPSHKIIEVLYGNEIHCLHDHITISLISSCLLEKLPKLASNALAKKSQF